MERVASQSVAGPLDRRWWVVAGAFLGMMSFSASRHMYPFVLPSMAAALQLPNERMGNISSAYFVAYMICSLLWGMLADRIGGRRVMLTGMAIIVTGLVAMGSTNGFLPALFFNLLCGAGASALSVPQVPLLSGWFPANQRGTAIGTAMMGNGFATFTFGLWIPLVIQANGWRWAWWASAILVLVLLIICFFLLRQPPARAVAPTKRGKGASEPAGPPPTMASVLRQRAAWNLAGIYCIWGAGYTVFMTFAVAYLREQKWDPTVASGAFSLWGLFTLFGSPAWGWLSDRIAKKWVLALTILLQGIGYVVFLGSSQELPALAFIGAAAVGFGQIGVPAVMSAATGDYFPHRVAGMAFGLLTLSFAGGCIIGPSLGGMISDAAGTLRSGLIFGFCALTVSGLATLLLQKPPARPSV